MSKLENVKKTIIALRARAADDGSSESEVMAAISKADKMMQENDITVEDLEDAVSKGGIVSRQWTRGTRKMHPVEMVAAPISQVTETKGWIAYPEDIAHLTFLGFEGDVEYALYLVDLIHNAMEAEWEEFRNSTCYETSPRNKRGRMREDFMRGMAVRIRGKLMDMVAKRRVNAPELGHTQGTELVVAKRTMIAEAVEEMGIDPRKRRNRKKKVEATAYLSGVAAGERTNVTTGINA